MKFSRIIQKITSTAVSLAMLSSLMVCAVPTVSAQQTDGEVLTAYRGGSFL